MQNAQDIEVINSIKIILEEMERVLYCITALLRNVAYLQHVEFYEFEGFEAKNNNYNDWQFMRDYVAHIQMDFKSSDEKTEHESHPKIIEGRKDIAFLIKEFHSLQMSLDIIIETNTNFEELYYQAFVSVPHYAFNRS